MGFSRNRVARLFLVLMVPFYMIGCGGGGDTSPSVTSSGPVLSWNPPQSFADQTPLDPARDLDHYEIYINETGNFASTDSSDASVSAIDPANGTPVTSFHLVNLGPFFTANKTYYISMKSVSRTGTKSDFSPSASFSL